MTKKPSSDTDFFGGMYLYFKGGWDLGLWQHLWVLDIEGLTFPLKNLFILQRVRTQAPFPHISQETLPGWEAASLSLSQINVQIYFI